MAVFNPIITGTTGNDTLTVLTDTSSVIAGAGTDIAVFTGDYSDYTFSQSDSYVSLLTHNTTEQAVSLFGVEQLQFDDVQVNLSTTAGNEFLVNTETTYYQDFPNITAISDGGFVITYSSNYQDGIVGRRIFEVYAQRYDANGNAVNDEFLVNTNTIDISNFGYGDSISLNDGGFLVTWTSTDDNGTGIYAQRYNSDGSKNGDEFQVNTTTLASQFDSNSTGLNDGGFVIIWTAHYQGPFNDGGDGIFAQRYNSDSSKNGDELWVSSPPESLEQQKDGSVTALNDGGFVIVWESIGQDGDGTGVYAQRYNSDGTKNAGEFRVNTETTGSQHNPATTSLNDGGFLVTWSGSGSGDDSGIYAQLYNSDGNKNGLEFRVNTYTIDHQYKPAITTLNDGGFVITWKHNNSDWTVFSIYAQRYNSDGSRNGDEFVVAANTYDSAGTPKITALNDGGFVITWQTVNQDYWESVGQEGDEGGNVYAQRYDSEGNALGEVTLDTIITGTTSTVDATIQTDATHYLDNTSINYIDDEGNDTGISSLVENGNVELEQTVDFDVVTLSAADAHVSGIQTNDATAILKHIVGLVTLTDGSVNIHAADVNNNGSIQTNDATAVLKHIVGLDSIDNFDLVDNSTGQRVTQIDGNSESIAALTIVENGDVNQSGSFDDDYTVLIDLV